jgi:diguanylate cyclase (GGDEF)-like protein
VSGMKLALHPSRVRLAFVGVALLLLVLIGWLALSLDNLYLLATMAVGLVLLASAYALLQDAEARATASDERANAALAELQKIHDARASRSSDLELLGRYGNLLIGCIDLAEALQISEQMFSLLLPESAGTIYPLIDGEGLAEATRLWGNHVGDTKLQASAEECMCMQSKRVHLGHSDSPDSLCAHVLMPSNGESLTAACIPLTAQRESLGWIYLSTPGTGTMPKLQVAIAAADQLALALANLKLRQSLRDLSVRDPLTGLFNRRYLSESLGREMARSKRRDLPLSVLAFDLDHFKDFNDRYGHPAGDAVLVAFARILQSNSRNEDIACRQGGEEFVLIMPEMDTSVAMRRAIGLMEVMSTMDVMHEGQLLPKLTTSIGLAVYPENGPDPAALLTQADQALYEAKAAGRNRIVVARSESPNQQQQLL